MSHTPTSDKPSVFFIGDSISLGYHPFLVELSRGVYDYGRKEGIEEAAANLDIPQGANGGNSTKVLRYLEYALGSDAIPHAWIAVNAGLHDIKRADAESPPEVDLPTYRKNLELLVELIPAAGKHLIWITTTPVDDEQHLRSTKTFFRSSADNEAYGQVAREIMIRKNIPILDLGEFTQALEGPLFRDHVHFPESVCRAQAAYIDRELRKLLGGGR